MGEVRRFTEADFDDFATILANAYPGMRIVSAEDRARVKERFLQTHNQDPLADYHGLFRDGKLLGGMRLHDFTMTLLSAKARVGGVGEVAVGLAYKKEKVARDMMAYFLGHCKKMGAPMAVLYPFRPDFYKRMGFGYGTKLNRYRVRPGSLPRGPSKEHVRTLGEADKQALLACYSRYADRTHGMIEKSPAELDRLFESPRAKIFGYEKDGQILGYLVFIFQRGKEDNWLSNDIAVREFIYETREALSELLTFLHTQLDQVRYILFDLHDGDFHYLLLDPRNESDNLIGPVYHETNTQGIGLMYRVLDTEGVFRVLRDHDFGGHDCRLKLSIRDDFVPGNHGSTVVHFEKGQPNLRAGGDSDVEVGLDVSDFSSLLVGTVSFRRLYQYGLAAISDPQYVATVNAIFRTEEKPVCTTMF
jgi:predicted acetyltransferase